jgi:hypothetical protein
VSYCVFNTAAIAQDARNAVSEYAWSTQDFRHSGATISGMTFQWSDLISLAADIVTFIGIPVLVYATNGLYREFKELRKVKGITEDCVTFWNVKTKCTINAVPFKKTGAIPRVGDYVYLPGERDGDRSYGDGKYKVVEINFHYREDRDAHPFIPAVTSAIEIHVDKIASLS